MLIKILIGAAIVLVLLAVIVQLQPGTFSVTRSATLAVPAADVFAQVNDFHKWEAWSPWAKLDPAARNAFTGPAAGPGAGFTWDGDSKVGAGRMTVIESKPNELIRIKLEFFRPMAGVNTTEFTFKPAGGQTQVTWAMAGDLNFIGKAIHLVVNMDKMVGASFEQGLAAMQVAAADVATAKK